MDMGPEERVPFALRVRASGGVGTVRVTGDFVKEGSAVLSLGLLPEQQP
jgi:hypothetical protein